MSDLNSFLTVNVGTSLTAVSTTPAAGKKHIIGSWVLANTSSNSVSVDCCIRRAAVDYYQVKGFTLQAGDTLFLHGLLGKVVLLAGDVLYSKSSVAASLDVSVSIAEEP